MTRDKAVAEAAKALGVTKLYNVRFMATVREEHSWDCQAHSLASAATLAQEYAHERLHVMFGDGGIEGDEIAYVVADEDDFDDEIEVDCRWQGEPFSWEAVRIVKLLAEAVTDDERQMIIGLAREACRVPDVTDYITDEPISNEGDER